MECDHVVEKRDLFLLPQTLIMIKRATLDDKRAKMLSVRVGKYDMLCEKRPEMVKYLELFKGDHFKILVTPKKSLRCMLKKSESFARVVVGKSEITRKMLEKVYMVNPGIPDVDVPSLQTLENYLVDHPTEMSAALALVGGGIDVARVPDKLEEKKRQEEVEMQRKRKREEEEFKRAERSKKGNCLCVG